MIEFKFLETTRILLRDLTPELYQQVMETYTDNELMKFFGYQSFAELEGEKNRFQLGMTMSGKSFNYFHLIEKKSEEVMGWCGYHTWFVKHLRAEIGYVLNQDKYKGKGYMKEALLPVLNYGFESMSLHRIEALISPNNEPSLKLIRRFGFTQEGYLREHYMNDNKLDDSLIFSLLKYEFDYHKIIESLIRKEST